jgi:predicted MPP superfamily phosphohydrolase
LSVARAADADLALAGHTHAGQIRMPWIGAIVCPSWYGMRYDAGLFHFPPTTMYVGRGLSCLTPLRFNCPAELTRLVLRRPGAKPEPGI